MAGKKLKNSDLTGIELLQAQIALKKLQSSLVLTEEDDTEDDNKTNADRMEDFSHDLEDMITRLESRLSGPQALNFSGVNTETLFKLNVVRRSTLRLKGDQNERVEKSRLVGKDQFWSSAGMYQHLALLERLIPRDNEAASRAWIDTFFFRASAMVGPEQRMVLDMENCIPVTAINPLSLATISGYTNYTALVAEADIIETYLDAPNIESARILGTGFFVTEGNHGPLHLYVPQANGDGASYTQSGIIRYGVTRPPDGGYPQPEQYWPDMIAGILSHWVQKSLQDFDNDDWFEELPEV
ncbi:hypothetical protein DXG01_005554 [Tephrocybe rancida]|nr:hypothetical protein DXG01_005554 [Tephrocybe rancida]